ncbi:MAG: hypothetical protein RLZZ312_1537 [Bacteroidota bacterium]|jgi:uncharacterized membrane protein YedE/YeeE
MKYIKFLLVGFLFGIVLTKSEAVSWYRIYEMFRFESFHMYGIIGVAILTGFLSIQFFTKYQKTDFENQPVLILDKEKGSFRYWIGGLIFGLGWGLVGTCPGPIFILLGAGFFPIIIVLVGALLGTFVYGLVKDKLPH